MMRKIIEFLFLQLHNYLQIYLPKERVCSNVTIKSYKLTLQLFLNFLCSINQINFSQLSYDLITIDSVSKFVTYLEDTRNCSKKTVNHHLTVIRSFLKYVGERHSDYMIYYTNVLTVPMKRVAKDLVVRFVDKNVIDWLLQQPDPRKRSEHRNLMFMMMLYDTGARCHEILNLKPVDIMLDKKAPYIVINGKGNKIRTTPLSLDTANHLRAYLKRFQIDIKDSTHTLFFTEYGGVKKQMSDDNVGRFFKKYCDLARKKHPEIPSKITPHVFRHSRAMHLYRAGMDLALVSQFLGHSHLETTYIYAYADVEMKRHAMP